MSANPVSGSFEQTQPKLEFTFDSVSERELLNLRHIPTETKIALNGLSVGVAEVQQDRWGINQFIGIRPEDLVGSLKEQKEDSAAKWFEDYVVDIKKKYGYQAVSDKLYFPIIAGNLSPLEDSADGIK